MNPQISVSGGWLKLENTKKSNRYLLTQKALLRRGNETSDQREHRLLQSRSSNQQRRKLNTVNCESNLVAQISADAGRNGQATRKKT